MNELYDELKYQFDRVDKQFQRLLERQRIHGDPISDRVIKRRHDLQICLDALAADDADSGGDDDDSGGFLPPQKEVVRQRHTSSLLPPKKDRGR